MEKQIKAIILAAGKGSRIGTPKIYLKWQGKYFIDLIYEKMTKAGIKNISAVVFTGCEIGLFECSSKIKWIINPNPDLGMFTSIYYGVMDSLAYTGFLIHPVDMPLVSEESYSILINTHTVNPDSVLRVKYYDKVGHPVLIPKILAERIMSKDLPGGLNEFIKKSGVNQSVVDLTDCGITKNINTQSDFNLFSKEKE